VFPNENHHILSPQNSIHWYWEYQDWLARHLALPRTPKPEFETTPE
jgi:dipeptidyl aminopeptidase/acylaminoacyl peptidase